MKNFGNKYRSIKEVSKFNNSHYRQLGPTQPCDVGLVGSAYLPCDNKFHEYSIEFAPFPRHVSWDSWEVEALIGNLANFEWRPDSSSFDRILKIRVIYNRAYTGISVIRIKNIVYLDGCPGPLTGGGIPISIDVIADCSNRGAFTVDRNIFLCRKFRKYGMNCLIATPRFDYPR